MIGTAVEKFRVNHETDSGYEVYYKNTNGSLWVYAVNYNSKGLAILTPARRVCKVSYETAKTHGIAF